MKLIKILTSVTCALAILASPAFAGDKTCCQEASAKGKECTHKCCLAAHKDGKSCEKCNPGKEDLKLKKKSKKSEKTTEKSEKTPGK